MSFEKDFLPLMSSQILVNPISDFDGYGKPTLSTPIIVRAHILQKSKIVRSNSNEDITLAGFIWIPPSGYRGTPSIKENDRLTLSDGDHLVYSVEVAYDESGSPHHQKVAYY